MAPGVLFLFGFWNKNALHMHYYTLPQRDQDQELLSLLVNKYTLDIKQLQDDEVLDLTFHERRKREKRAQKLLRGLELLHRLSNKKRNFAMGFFLALYHRPKKLNHSALTEYEPCKSPFAAADDLQLLESTRLNGQKVDAILIY